MKLAGKSVLSPYRALQLSPSKLWIYCMTHCALVFSTDEPVKSTAEKPSPPCITTAKSRGIHHGRVPGWWLQPVDVFRRKSSEGTLVEAEGSAYPN